MKSPPEVRVCLDARLGGGHPGGLEQVVIGLASAFSRFDEGPEEYLLLVDPRAADWLSPYVSGPCSLLPVGATTWRVYRKAAGQKLGAEEHALLAAAEKAL